MKHVNKSISSAAVLVLSSAIAPVHAAPGDLDETFGVGSGTVITNVGDMRVASSAAVQADGKIILGGCVEDNIGNCNFSLARFTSAGILDTSFGIGGLVTTDFDGGLVTTVDGGSSWVSDVIIQPNGRIVAVGRPNNHQRHRPGAVRLRRGAVYP